MIYSPKAALVTRSRTLLQSLESIQQDRIDAAASPEVHVMEVMWRSIDSGTLHDVCSDLLTFDIDIHHQQIKKVLLGFSLTIRGVPECALEDLPLAVYLLIEDVLGIRSSIDLCVKYTEGKDPAMIVGVMFDDRNIRNMVLKKSSRFKGTDIVIAPNMNFQWILDNY